MTHIHTHCEHYALSLSHAIDHSMSINKWNVLQYLECLLSQEQLQTNSSKKVPSLKLPDAFHTLILKEKAYIMSWDNQVSAEEGRSLVSGRGNCLIS